MVLAYLVPGAGHFFLGRRTRAAVFFVVVMLMFALGLALHGKLYTFEQGWPLPFFATLGSMGAGIPYFVARLLSPFRDYMSVTYEYGTVFTLTAGLMNLLLVLDVFDIGEGRKG